MEEVRLELARTISRIADLAWLCLPDADGGWLEVRDGGARLRCAGARPSRVIDFGLARSLPAEQLVRVGASAIGRNPRWTGAGLSEVFVYRDRRNADSTGVLGCSSPLRVDVAHLESWLRTWFAIDALGERRRGGEEEARWARIGRDTACIAHDLRHSLTLVGLELDRGAVERAREDLRGAVEICDRGLGKSGPRMTCESVKLIDLMREAGGRERVEVRCAEDLELWTDRVLLGRLLRNLVLNALEASPEGRHVALEAATLVSGEVSITVRDSGRGMPQAELADLLRLGRSGSSGSGIGSASAEDCARALGACLEIRTRLGRGTEVRIRIASLGS